MIIDAHTHIWGKGYVPKGFYEDIARMARQRTGSTITVDEMLAQREARGGFDGEGDKLVATLDAAGVDAAQVGVLDYGLTAGWTEADYSIEELNRLYSVATKKHAGRLIMAAGVDPRRPNAAAIVEKAAKEYGARAVKLYPPTGWYPNDRITYPVYEKCVEYGLVANFHTGPIFGATRSKFSHPEHLEDVAKDFPELTVQATHTGHGLWYAAIAIARSNPNIICDIGGWQNWLDLSQPIRMYQEVRWMMDMLGPGRLMFATDAGGGDPTPYIRWVKAWTEIPAYVEEAGVKFTKEEMDAFLGGTCAKIYKLDK